MLTFAKFQFRALRVCVARGVVGGVARGVASCVAMALMLGVSGVAQAERIKDLATIQGVRNNQLLGYGLVVGLDGTGEQTPFTVQSVKSMLTQMGVNLPPETKDLPVKNVAAVIVTAVLPPFARPGQTLDVTASSIGSAKSLRGGTLLMTPLKGADGQIYGMAQGHLLVSGAGAAAGGDKMQVNHLSVGRIPGGATVERAVQSSVGQGDFVNLEMKDTDFTMAMRVVEAINAAVGEGKAMALDGRAIQVTAPMDVNARVAFIAKLENLEIAPGRGSAKVIINARTGTVVMNQAVAIETFAVSHGNLTLVISSEPLVSQPAPLSQGQTVVAQRSQIELSQPKNRLILVPASALLADVVDALGSIGATPLDLLAILQAMKSAGVLRAELEII